jgi:hypothetical protein
VEEVDPSFYDRADAHIHLSNSQLSDEVGAGKVSASSMYSVARFNAWLTAAGWNTAEEMAAARPDAIDYFSNEFRKMLEEHFDDYIDNFDSYTNPSDQS